MGTQATKKCRNCSGDKEQQKLQEEHSFSPPPIQQSNINSTNNAKQIQNTKDSIQRGPTLNELIDIYSQDEQDEKVEEKKDQARKWWQCCNPRVQQTSWEDYQHGQVHQKMMWEHFDTDYILGKGSLAQVFLGEFKHGEIKPGVTKCALKRMKKRNVKTKLASEHIRIQKTIMRECGSNFITQLYGSFRDHEHYYLIMELAEGGDVYSLIKENSPRINRFKQGGEPAIRFILACIILGLEEMHSKGYIYNDLKPQNLLIFTDGYVKLADFGLSKYYKGQQGIQIVACTPLYCPPEIIRRDKCGNEVDLWMLGVIAYELANFKCPFKVHDILDSEYFSMVVQSWTKHPQWANTNISPQLKDFITQLLNYQPKKRLGANQDWTSLKSHDFFDGAGFNWHEIKQKKMISPLRPIIKVEVQREKVLEKDDEEGEDDLRWTQVLTIDNWSRFSG